MTKFWVLGFMILMALTSSCGKNNSENSSNRGPSTDPYRVSTFDGFVHAHSGMVEVSGGTYIVSQQSFQVMSMALQQAMAQGIQPINVNGVFKFRARITGSLISQNYGGYYPQSGYQPGLQQLNITQMIIIR
jgi:hypothetical protein